MSGATFAHGFTPLPDDELANAAVSLREAEIEAVQSEPDSDEFEPAGKAGKYDTISELSPQDVLRSMKLTQADLDSMSIDELRAVANVLDIPNRGAITEKSELAEEILRRV